jgi:SAM-dependent methyltransferase
MMQHLSGAKKSALEETLPDTLARWSTEADDLEKQGAYDWLCSRVSEDRILEIGCGFGHSTAALAKHGKMLFALDNRMDCLEAARERVPDATYGLADIRQVHELLIKDLNEFAPQAMVLWIGGAPADALPRDIPEQYAVMQYRLAFQQAAVALAGQIHSIQTIHLADRTMLPWSMKDAGRQTMMQLIKTSVIDRAPFSVSLPNVQFRKLSLPASSIHHAMPGNMVPVLGEATLERIQSGASSVIN